MHAVFADFERQCYEIHRYFRFVERALDENSKFIPAGHSRASPIDTDLQRILKANCYLLLYNLIESATRAAFRELYSAVAVAAVPFPELSQPMQDEWVRYVSKRLSGVKDDRLRERLREILEGAVNGVAVRLPHHHLSFSGNLDAAVIRDACIRHGIRARVHRSAKGGGRLSNIKRERNRLAHGDGSFTEIGGAVAWDDLRSMKAEAINFVRSILRSVDGHIANQEFVRK